MGSFFFLLLSLLAVSVAGQWITNHCWFTFTWNAEKEFEGDLVFQTTAGEYICDGWGGCSVHKEGPCPDAFVMFNNDTVTPSKLTQFGFMMKFEDQPPHSQFGGRCSVSGDLFRPTVVAGAALDMRIENSTLYC